MKPILLIFLSGLSFSLWAQPEGLFRQAESLSEQGRYEASNERLDEFIKTFETRRYDLGEAHFLKSYNFLKLGELQEALAENELSLQLRQQFIPEDAAKNYLRFGQIYTEWRQYERALAFFYQAEDFPLIDNPQMAALLKESIGAAFLQVGAFEEARAAYQQLADILEIEEGEESAGAAEAYYHIGRAYMLEEQPQEARRWLEKALGVEEQLKKGAGRPARIYLALGQAAEQEHDGTKAEDNYQRALQAYRGLPGNKYPGVARSLLHIAQLKMQRGDFGGARMAVQGALQNICPDFRAEQFTDNPPEDSRIISYPLLVEAMANKSSIGIAAYQAGEGAAPLEQALASSLSGIALAEEKAEKPEALYEAAATSAFLLHQETGKQMYAEQAFQWSEHARELSLPLYSSDPPADWQGLSQRLEKNEALLAYFLAPQAAFVQVFTHKGVETARLDSDAPGLSGAIASLLRSIKEEDAAAFADKSTQLYEQLLAPLEKLLKKKDQWIIVPYGPLHNLPFEALLNKAPKDGQAYHKMNFLIEDVTIQYRHSVSGMGQPPVAEQAAGLLAVVPLYGTDEGNGVITSGNAYLFNPAYQFQSNLREVVPDGKALLPLAGAVEEISALEQAFNEKATLFLGKNATEKALATHSGQYRYLHLSAYGFSHPINPDLSGIALSQEEASGQLSGLLFVPEITGLSLSASLVALPHCACGSTSSQSGVAGISRAFLKAGAAQVLAGLWLDGQYPAHRWIGSFYEKLINGESPAVALQQFKEELLREEDTAAPKKWSGIVLIGR